MDQGLIPRRYAKALLMFASEKGADKAVYEAMLRLAAAFAAEPGLQHAMANPHVGAADKLSLVESAAGADAAAAPVITDMVGLLEQNRRMDYLRDIALAYVALYRTANKIYRVDITSAASLQKAEIDRIHALVMKHLPQGATAEFTETVNPELIGGFTVSIDNELLDASVANDLKQLRLKLLSH